LFHRHFSGFSLRGGVPGKAIGGSARPPQRSRINGAHFTRFNAEMASPKCNTGAPSIDVEVNDY
jgi:hypothetical protein